MDMIKEAGRLIVTGLTAGIMIGFTVLVILLAEASVKIPAVTRSRNSGRPRVPWASPSDR